MFVYAPTYEMTVYARAAHTHTHRQRAAALISVDVDADLEARSKERQAASVPPAPGLPNSVRFIEAGWKKEAEFSTNDIFQIFFFFKKTPKLLSVMAPKYLVLTP